MTRRVRDNIRSLKQDESDAIYKRTCVDAMFIFFPLVLSYILYMRYVDFFFEFLHKRNQHFMCITRSSKVRQCGDVYLLQRILCDVRSFNALKTILFYISDECKRIVAVIYLCF